jgi:hypothetical protein
MRMRSDEEDLAAKRTRPTQRVVPLRQVMAESCTIGHARFLQHVASHMNTRITLGPKGQKVKY